MARFRLRSWRWLILTMAIVAAFGMGRMARSVFPTFGPALALADEHSTDNTLDAEGSPVTPRVFGNRDRGEATAETPTVAGWEAPERYQSKFVPVISLLQGTRVGVARINGPRSRVTLTHAVSQFAVDFGGWIRIDVYVPVPEARGSLSRIQGVGVTGLGETVP